MAYTRSELENMLRAVARRYGIDERIAVAQIQQESGFRPNATSPAGAQGIAQFMPGTWARFGSGSPYDPAAAFEAWGRLMSYLLRRYNNNYSLALAAYNAGEGNVAKYNGVPPFTETRNYVRIILANAGSVPSGSNSALPNGQQTQGLSTNKVLLIGLLIIIVAIR